MFRLGTLVCLIGLAASSIPGTKTRKQVEEYRDALVKSRLDDGQTLESRMLENPKAHVWENSGKFQGDIVLTDAQLDTLVASYANVSDGNRAACIIPNTRWPGNVVLYEFGTNEFNAAQQRAILDAMTWVEHFSCIRFRRRGALDRRYVWITGGPGGCFAQVGFSTAHTRHTLNLARNNPGVGCLNNIVIIHELLHNLGFFHMQSAYERYNYVRVNWNNIVNGAAHNFYRLARTRVSLLNLAYEYQSCMHYGPHAFTRNGLPTMTATRSIPAGSMGHMRYVTHLDWVRLRRLYNCPGGRDADEIEEVKAEVERMMPLMEQNLPPPKEKPSFNQEIVNEEYIGNEEDFANDVNVFDEAAD